MTRHLLPLSVCLLVALGCGGGAGDPETPPTAPPAGLPSPPPAPAVTQVTLTPNALSLVGAGQSGALSATVRTSAGVVAAPTIAWSTSNAAVATVTGTGTSASVTSVAVGTATITAASGGQTATAVITVSPPPPLPVATVSIAPGLVSLDEGGTATLTAEVRDASGTLLPDRAVLWSSSDTLVAAVSPAGTVSARVEGDTVTITAMVDGVSGSARVLVRSLYFLATDVSAGGSHTCAIRVTGGVWCWGTNSSGQLGTPTATAGLPVQPINGNTFRQVVTGMRHTCALDGAARAHCWGDGRDGELGDSATFWPRSSSPVPVHGNRTFSRLEAGDESTCGIAQGGAAYCWGENTGFLGTGIAGDAIVPRILVGGHSWSALSGGTFNCGITTANQSLCWGPGSGHTVANRIGDGTGQSRAVPTAIAGSPAFVQVSAGHDMGCAIDAAGDAWCWGHNRSGQLGIGNLTGTRVPVRVQSTEKFVSIAAGQVHVCAIATTGQAWCWGEGRRGQLGNDAVVNSTLPVRVAQNDERFTQISTRWDFTCAVSLSRRVYCWGDNVGGSLGFAGGRSSVPLPVRRPEP